MRSSHALHEELSDAIARGRLCLGEGCGFTRAELDALCELGAEKLELGLIQESVTVLRGLVALYPYSAKYYLCLGLALMQATQFTAAAAALELAATLSPEDPTVHIYLIEAKLRSGQLEEAQREAAGYQMPTELSEAMKHRWERIAKCLDQIGSKTGPTPIAQNQITQATMRRPQTTFKLPNGKPLPLEKSKYEVTQPWVPVPKTEKTQTDFSPMTFDESITITAVVRRRKPIRERPSPANEVTQTAVIVRRKITQESRENSEDTAIAYFADNGSEE